jgi:pyruvate dehydrogenase E2 component (dihydrolipoamide acetyltransferase)
MATEVFLPKLGQTMEEGTIVEWMKKEGDKVNRGDVLFTVESDKAVLEVESSAKGVLRRILIDKGAKVPVLTTVGIIGEAGEDISGLLQKAGPAQAAVAPASQPAAVGAAPQPAPQAVVAPEPAAVAPQPIPGRERVFASPRARRVAEEKQVDLDYVAGSGPNGRIIEKDVLEFAARQPLATPLARKVAAEMGVSLEQIPTAGGRITAEQVRAAAAPAGGVPAPAVAAAGEVVPLSGVRAIIAERMGNSSRTTAAVTLESLVDATELVALRTRLKEALAKELGFDVGYNDLLALIVARCLVEFPYMNVRLDAEGIRHLQDVNVGLAVDTERGLIVPVIRNAQHMGLKELATKFRQIVARAREGKAGPDDLTGGTFTITNLGMFGVDAFTPIINLPECAILGVGRIKPEAAVVNGEVVVRQRMWLSLTFDHRLVDGAPAARFLQGILKYIETPYLLLS